MTYLRVLLLGALLAGTSIGATQALNCDCTCDDLIPCGYEIDDILLNENGLGPTHWVSYCGPGFTDVEVRHANLFVPAVPMQMTHVCAALRSPTGGPNEMVTVFVAPTDPNNNGLPGTPIFSETFTINTIDDHQLFELTNPPILTGTVWVGLAYPSALCTVGHQGIRDRTANDAAVFVGDGNTDWLYYDNAGGPYVNAAPIIRPIGLAPVTEAILAQPTSGLTTSETGTTDTFEVWLAGQPNTYVILDLASTDTTEGIPSPAFLQFDEVNWATPQVVTLTGQDDAVVDGDIPYSITMSITSDDPCYRVLTAPQIDAVNLDDDDGTPAESTTWGAVKARYR